MSTPKSILYHIYNENLPNHLGVSCKCGWLYVTNDNKSNITCTNPICPIQNSYKVKYALDVFNLKADMADARALEFINYFNFRTHMDIFGLLDIDMPEGIPSNIHSSYIKLTLELERLQKEGVTMIDFMSAFNLDDLGATRCKLIFSNVSNPEEFYKEFSENSEENLQEVHQRLCKWVAGKISISWDTRTVVDISRRLLLLKPEILRVAKFFNFRETHSDSFNIAITGEITSTRPDGTKFKPREKFAEYLSDKYKININVLGLSEKHVGVLIMDTDMTGNRKYIKAMESREKSGGKPIEVMTSKEFEDFIASISSKK